jgi:hypothetical protein
LLGNFTSRQIGGIIDGMSTVRLIKHEAVPRCGSFEVRFSDGSPSQYFYWDDVAGGRLRPEQVGSKEALAEAKAFARAARATADDQALMKFVERRPFSDPEAAARKLIVIANSVEPVQDGRIHIELINWPFLQEHRGCPVEYEAGLDLAIARGWLAALKRCALKVD